MTQGALGHSGAQGRAKGFHQVIDGNANIKLLDEQPADWDVTKVARIWESLLTQYPDIKGAFFHNDDMALAAHNVMKAKNRTDILIAGVDAMPPAVNAVLEGTMVATVRNPSCRIHGWSVAAGVAAVAGRRNGRQGHSGLHPRRRPGHHQGNRGGPSLAAEELPDLISGHMTEPEHRNRQGRSHAPA